MTGNVVDSCLQGKAASTGLSTAATVPSVSATATLTNFVVSNFSTDAKTQVGKSRFVIQLAMSDKTVLRSMGVLQYCDTIEANILTSYGVVSSCIVGAVTPGSVVVPTTVAFNGENLDAATAAQAKFFSALKSSDNSVFGSSYGTVSVDASSIKSGTTANPEGNHWPVCSIVCFNGLLPVSLFLCCRSSYKCSCCCGFNLDSRRCSHGLRIGHNSLVRSRSNITIKLRNASYWIFSFN